MATPGLEPGLRRLCAAARNLAGLNVLLVFGRDPMACDTASGFALRLQRPEAEMREALGSLAEHGVLAQSRRTDDPATVSYWLAEGSVFPTLRALLAMWTADPGTRCDLFRAVAEPCDLQPA
jgi:hypothetical protein